MWKIASVVATVLVAGTIEGAISVWLPIVSNPAPPTATPQPSPTPTATQPAATATPTPSPTPTQPAGPCSCAGDLYNCSHFSRQSQAQACFNYCKAIVGYDIHRLDGDGNGRACESLP